MSAVVLAGGKQYRVAPGDRILVDRMDAELGSSIKLGRVLMLANGDDLKVGSALAGLYVDARVVGHPRGPRIETLRYKSKKRVRVHRGGRAHLTSLEITAVGGVGRETTEDKEVEEETPRSRGRAKAARPKADRQKKTPVKAEAAVETKVETKEEEAPKKATRRRSKKETE